MATGVGGLYKVGIFTYKGIRASLNLNRVFYSGRSAITGVSARVAAESYAVNNGAVTIEMTLTGKILDKITTQSNFSRLGKAWSRLSARFSQKTQNATVYQGARNRGTESVLEKIERPIFDRNGITYDIHIVE